MSRVAFGTRKRALAGVDGGARLINNHPLPDGNKRVGYLCALEFVARNGGTWTQPPNDPEGDDTVATIEGVAASQIDEDTLTTWIEHRLV